MEVANFPPHLIRREDLSRRIDYSAPGSFTLYCPNGD